MARANKSKPQVPQPDEATVEEKTGNWLTRLLFRPRMLLLLALAVSSTVFVPMLTDSLSDLSQRDAYRLQTANIEITTPPRWVPDNLVEQVVERAELPEQVSLLDDHLTKDVAQAFRQHPWVSEVVAVRKSVPARIEVELAYRKPVAMVQVKRGMYPIDADGILLPPQDFSLADTKRYPIIQNAQSTPQGPAGTNWGDVGVLGAARLAEILVPYWKRFDLLAIRIPRRTSANTTIKEVIFELSTQGGSRIVWGRAPGSAHPGELSAEQKIGRLEKYHGDFGGFDEPHGPYEIDIRHWQEISRRPLSAARRRMRH